MPAGEQISNHAAPNEPPVHRWTSEKVLTTGVEQGWADPTDPREVNFSNRPSCEGLYQLDDEGRPLNRHRTPDMPGDRGNLGKWGPNYAAESLIVTTDNTGKRYILLVRRNDPERTDEEQQWSLPGGMVDAGEHASATAIREVREEVGVDLSQTPFKTLYQMYANDFRNTRNAWIETTGTLHMLHYTPQTRPDGVEISAARWFELPDTLAQLEAQTGKLFASHGEGIKKLLEHLRGFKDGMDEAQQLHGQGRFAEARQKYLEVAGMLPDPLESGRALRGAAAGAGRMGDTVVAMGEAQKAVDIHDEAVRSFPEEAQVSARRERAASRGVLGQIAIAALVQHERFDKLTLLKAQAAAQNGVTHLDQAYEDILTVEAASGTPDQYKINIMSRLALAHSLYGDRAKGRNYARQALALGRRSEAKNNPTSADLPRGYRLRAMARGVPRGLSAVAVSHLATRKPGVRRRAALALAANRRTGI